MAFSREAAVQPSTIGDIAIELFDPAPGSGGQQSATASIQVVMDDGQVRVRRVNLPDHLSAQIITNLRDLATLIRSRANSEILPEQP